VASITCRGGRSRGIGILALVAWVLLATGCRNEEEIAKDEYEQLRKQLVRISVTPTEHLEPELDRLEDLEIRTSRIVECRDACLEAYRAISDASAKSRQVQDIISEIENGDLEDMDIETLEARQTEAIALLEESETALDDARELKDECHELLESLEGEGLDRER